MSSVCQVASRGRSCLLFAMVASRGRSCLLFAMGLHDEASAFFLPRGLHGEAAIAAVAAASADDDDGGGGDCCWPVADWLCRALSSVAEPMTWGLSSARDLPSGGSGEAARDCLYILWTSLTPLT